MPFLLLCVERAFPSRLPQELRTPPPPQPPLAHPHLAAPVSAESGGGLLSGLAQPLPPRAPHLRLHKARHAAPRGVAEPCQGSWCFWRLQAKTHFKLFEICLPFSRGDGEAGSQGAPSVRPSNLSLTRTSPSDYAPSTYQAGAGCWGTATAWADPHPCLLRVQSGGREEV